MNLQETINAMARITKRHLDKDGCARSYPSTYGLENESPAMVMRQLRKRLPGVKISMSQDGFATYMDFKIQDTPQSNHTIPMPSVKSNRIRDNFDQVMPQNAMSTGAMREAFFELFTKGWDAAVAEFEEFIRHHDHCKGMLPDCDCGLQELLDDSKLAGESS